MDTRTLPLAFALCCPLWAATPAAADDAPPVIATDEQAELQSLMTILEEQTEIATKTKLNADYVPGMVTVLHGPTLENSGISTVWEALRRVPGFDMTRDRTGNLVAIVRGSGGVVGSGNLKVLLDGIAMNDTSAGFGDTVFSMPTEQVDRIEVIRGPGSALYGEFAYAGVINVVTRKEGTRAFVGMGDRQKRKAGFITTWRDPSADAFLNLNIAGSILPRSNTTTGPDWLHSTMGGALQPLSHAPGPILDGSEEGSAILNGGVDALDLTAYWGQHASEDFGGSSSLLPPSSDGLTNRSTTFGFRLEYKPELGETLTTRVDVGMRDYTNRYDHYFFPAGMPWQTLAGAMTALIVDDRAQGYYHEREWRGGGDLTWNPNDQHTVLLSASASRIDVVDSWLATTLDPATYTPLATPVTYHSGFFVPIDPSQSRTALGLSLQDEYRPNEALTVTAGVRYDRFSDVGKSVNPRLAVVWRMDRANILKAQYAEAFRPPTFFESHRGSGVRPETLASVEIGYIHRGDRATERMTLFDTHYRDLILENGLLVYGNAQNARAQGIEVEGELEWGSAWSSKANLSYLRTRDSATGEAIAGTAPWLGNLILTYNLASTASLEASLHHTGSRYREAGDSRAKLASATTTDIAGSWSPVQLPGLTLSGTVRNLLNADTRYPSMLTPAAYGSLPGYPNDLPGSGRSWWLKLAYTL